MRPLLINLKSCQKSKYETLANETSKWCPADGKDKFEKNCKMFPDNKSLKYYKKHPITYKFNNYGFRTDDDFNSTDEGNIFLGCSYTIGIGHHLKNTWSYKLNEHIGGKFWNLSLSGAGVDTAFRLLYGFKKILKIKNIFHYAPLNHGFRYEYLIKSDTDGNHSYPQMFNVVHNTESAIEFFGKKFVKEALLTDNFAKLNYDKSILAIESLSKKLGSNYYYLSDDILQRYRTIENDDSELQARDLEHYPVNMQNYIYKNFLEKYDTS